MTQLVLCFDGTNNNITGGRNDTSVAKLCKVLAPGADSQLLYYDPGVGNPGALPGATWSDRIRGKMERVWGLAFGRGVYENIADAYLFLMRNWHIGDQIYVYGFSRGAFTARSVAGMVARFGILRPTMEGMVSTMVHLYFADPKKDAKQYNEIRKQIAASFCDPAAATADVWFVGVWDTVESVGSPLSRPKISVVTTIVGKRFRHVRQALALDEHRRSFLPRPYYIHPTYPYAANGQSIVQLWWRGAHCDIGGGYSDDEAELSDEGLLWMLEESIGKGLLVNSGIVTPGGGLDRGNALTMIRGSAPAVPQPRAPLAHSETFIEAYWALTGLSVRRYDGVNGEPGDPPASAPVAHPSAANPVATVWNRPRHQTVQLLAAAAAAALFSLLHGSAVSGNTALRLMSGWTDVAGLWLIIAIHPVRYANHILSNYWVYFARHNGAANLPFWNR